MTKSQWTLAAEVADAGECGLVRWSSDVPETAVPPLWLACCSQISDVNCLQHARNTWQPVSSSNSSQAESA